MVRIKVFPLRKIIYRIKILLVYFLVFTLIIILNSVFLVKKTIVIEEAFSRNLFLHEFKLDKTKIIQEIIKNKVKILSNIDSDDLGERNEQYNITEEQIIQNEENIIYNEEPINVNIVEYKKWNRPSEYKTEILENGNIIIGNTKINNYSKLSLNVDYLKKVSNFKIDSDTSFLIFHTHTSETYSIDNYIYSDYYRTENEEYNILSVGKFLANELKNKGYNCVQDRTVHDYPSYNGAYKASLETVEEQLKNNKFDFVIDIHRDAISSNEKFRPTAEINGESVAKLMFVIGTNSAGLSHDEWIENLKLAIMIQNRANEMYPGLFRDLHLSNSRYNQHVSSGAMILEVGATGNTLEEAQNAMKYFAEVIDSMK